MEKLIIAPEEAGYAGEFPGAALSVRLRGGPSKTRQDFIGSPIMVSARWALNRFQYSYIQAFFREVTQEGVLPFLLDLPLHGPNLEEYQVKIVPGTFGLSGVRGTKHMVSAELEVVPKMADVEYDQTLLMLVGLYGEDVDAVLSTLAELVNESMGAM